MRYLVAVCGPIGGGKTSVVRALAKQLDDAAAIHMDDYECMTRMPVHHLAQWVERGANCDELLVPLLGDHLRMLKRGEPVLGPERNVRIAPRKYILLETQFGREHKATGEQIDLLIWIDAPLDIALARKLKSFTADALRAGHAEGGREPLAWLDDYLANYLALVRQLMRLQEEKVRPRADVVLDGHRALDVIVHEARKQVLQRLP